VIAVQVARRLVTEVSLPPVLADAGVWVIDAMAVETSGHDLAGAAAVT